MAENVVICCAEEDEPALAPLVSTLHSHGCNPEVVAGLDVDPMRLGHFIDTHESGSLYVLCESARFKRRAILQAEGMFGARHAPSDRLIRVVLETGHEQIARRVLSALGGGGSSDPGRPEGARHGGVQREVLGSGSRGNGAGWSRQSAAHRAAAISRAQMQQPSPADAPVKRARGGSGTAPNAGGGAPPPDSFAPAETPADPSIYDRPVPPPSDGGVEVDLDSRGSEAAEPEHATLPPLPAPVQPASSRTTSMVLLVVMAAAAGTAWLVMKDRDASRESGERGAPTVEVADGGQEEAFEIETGSGESLEPNDESDGGGVGEQPPIEFREGEDRAELREAIDKGELRVLDLLHVATAPLTKFNYPQAVEHCATLQVGGFEGFRLPGPDELKSIRRSHMMDRGRFWTNKPAGKNHAFIMDTAKNPAIQRARTKLGGVRAICVRER